MTTKTEQNVVSGFCKSMNFLMFQHTMCIVPKGCTNFLKNVFQVFLKLHDFIFISKASEDQSLKKLYVVGVIFIKGDFIRNLVIRYPKLFEF